jgi:hypothetical protein
MLANYPLEGVYIGVVGARFEKLDKMESQHILVQKKYNTIVFFAFF